MLSAQLHSFDHSPFSAVSLHTSIAGSYFFAKPLTTQCSAAILQLNSHVIAKCDWIFSLILSPVMYRFLRWSYQKGWCWKVACLKVLKITKCNVFVQWVVPEKIHTPPTDGILEILAGGGVKDPGNPGGTGGWTRKSLLQGSSELIVHAIWTFSSATV